MKLRENPVLSYLILVALAALLWMDFAVGDPQLFTLINLGMSHVILDVACAYGSIVLFSAFALVSLAVLYVSNGGELRAKARAGGLVAVLSGLLSYFLGSMLKMIVKRPRPFEVLPARTVGIWHTSTFSLPSTTTMLVFGFALPILFDRPRLGGPLLILASFIGFSVVYTGFHYPGDVIAGALFSTAIALSMYRAKPQIANLLTKYGFG